MIRVVRTRSEVGTESEELGFNDRVAALCPFEVTVFPYFRLGVGRDRRLEDQTKLEVSKLIF